MCKIAIFLSLVFSAYSATFTVDPARSRVTLSGTVGGTELREQGPGSLSTTVSGQMDVAAIAGEIAITSARLDANVSGNWSPGVAGQASSPADFGGKSPSFLGDITGALREIVLEASSPARTVSSTGAFDASSIVFSFPTNSASVIDYDAGFLGKDSKVLAGAGTNRTATVGTLIESSGTQTLTLALDATFYFSLVGNNDTILRLTGQLVATAAASIPTPHIGGIQLSNGQVVITASATSPATRLESSTDLRAWTPRAPAITAEGSNRTYTLPVTGKMEFFRLVE